MPEQPEYKYYIEVLVKLDQGSVSGGRVVKKPILSNGAEHDFQRLQEEFKPKEGWHYEGVYSAIIHSAHHLTRENVQVHFPHLEIKVLNELPKNPARS